MSLLYISTLAEIGLDITIVIVLEVIILISIIISIWLAIYYLPVFKMLSGKHKELPGTESPVYDRKIDNNYNNDELIAVISAAVAAYLSETDEETGSAVRADTKFKVLSFRKVR